MTNETAATADREIVISRTFDAPRELVWRAWTDPQHVGQWWGPNGFTTTTHEMNVKPGGVWRFIMHGPGGMEFPNKTEYLEVVKPERLVYWQGADIANDPGRFHVTVTFEQQDSKTGVTMRALFPTAAQRELVVREYNAIEGGQQTLARLAEHLTKMNRAQPAELVIVRVSRRFAAMPEQVFDAWLDPAHVGKWLFATPEGKMTKIEIDARAGGRFTIVERRGETDANHYGEYLEIDRPRRLVFSFADNWGLADAGRVEIEIAPLQSGCELTLTHEMSPQYADYREKVQQGWTGILQNLAEKVFAEGGATMKENAKETSTKPFVISRTFDAPRELVWKACTEPERMQQWFSPKGFTGRVVKADIRPGGTYLYCMTGPDGSEMWGKAVYREIVPPEKIVYINSFSDAQGGIIRHPMSATWPLEMHTTFEFAEHAGKTTLTITWLPWNSSAEERKTFDGAHAGMNMGWTGSLDQLAAYLAQG